MARVQVAQVGAITKTIEASSVKQALELFGLEGNYQVKLNGRSAALEDSIPSASEDDLPMISVGQKVKGGGLN